jgi:hypothetical protein
VTGCRRNSSLSLSCEKSAKVRLKVDIIVRGGWMRTPILVFDHSKLPSPQQKRWVMRDSQLETDKYYVSILAAMAQEMRGTIERFGEAPWPLRVCLYPTDPRLLTQDTFSHMGTGRSTSSSQILINVHSASTPLLSLASTSSSTHLSGP